MCAGAIAHARIARLYYAAADSKGGAVEHGARVFEHEQCLHAPEVYSGMGAEEASGLLRAFFAARRGTRSE
jgi:tRNA(adenine34) deaminase